MKKLLVVLLVIIVAGLAAAGYFFRNRLESDPPQVTLTPATEAVPRVG